MSASSAAAPPAVPRKPTPRIQKEIVAFLRAGGFPHVAAEAAGVPRRVFDEWMKRGERRRAGKCYREFARAVRQAIAQARLQAEITAHDEKPLDWLRSGPGRQTRESAGWTAAPRAPGSGAAEGTTPPLEQPEVQALVAILMSALTPFPQARAAAAAALLEAPPFPPESGS